MKGCINFSLIIFHPYLIHRFPKTAYKSKGVLRTVCPFIRAAISYWQKLVGFAGIKKVSPMILKIFQGILIPEELNGYGIVHEPQFLHQDFLHDSVTNG
jgi:hypothetical protein